VTRGVDQSTDRDTLINIKKNVPYVAIIRY